LGLSVEVNGPHAVVSSSGFEPVTFGLESIGRAGNVVVVPAVAEVTVQESIAWQSYSTSAGVISEYWRVDNGIEHGYLLNSRPVGEGPVEVHLSISGATAQLASAGLVLHDVRGDAVLDWDQLVAWDATGRVVPTTFRTTGATATIVVDDSGAQYPLLIDPTFSQQAYLKASNTGAGDQFGSSVAVDGDTVVVGAPLEDSSSTGVGGLDNDSASDSGAAYVFIRTGTTWTQQAYVKASNTGAGDQFGSSVAVDGDTVVVGAPLEDSNSTGVGGAVNDSASDSGAAYVFIRTGTTWTEQAYVKASNTGASDRFGYSVAVDGDTVVVGALLEDSNSTGGGLDNSASDSGAAYVFTRTGTTWTEQAYLKASNTGAGDDFGYSVAVDGDTVVVGALLEDSNSTGGGLDNSASDSGAAYVFTRTGTTWTQQAYLKASNTGAGDYFGSSVAVSGDTVVVGALAEDIAAGAAYMFLITADVATSGAAGVPGIFLTLTGGVGSLVSQATLRFGADRAAREGGFVVTLISETTPATQRILAVGAFNGGGHLDDRVSMPALGAGTYLVILVGVGPGGEALRLGNRFSVNGAGQYVSITAELLQPSL
jgi:hypothetical protein